MKSLRKGFSIIEVILVLVIIGLLAAVFVPATAKVRQKVKDNVVYEQLSKIAKTAKTYLAGRTVEQVSYKTLVDEKQMPALESVQGEKYDDIVVKKNEISVSISLPDGRIISAEY